MIAIFDRNYIIFDESEPFDCHGITVTPLPVYHGVYFVKKEPYYSLGFIFNRSIAYISDVSYIPESTWDILLGKTAASTGRPHVETLETAKNADQTVDDAVHTLTNGPVANGYNQSNRTETTENSTASGIPPILVIDCLRVYPHTSHFG